jgi:hypothetical protein
MGYNLKNTSGLINTRFTDAGRRKLSQGKLDIRYFQIGDSEVFYNSISGYNQTNTMVLMPDYNAQNITPQPDTNKSAIKYPYFVKGSSGNTYGLPFEDARIDPVYNTAGPKGFFTGSSPSWDVQIGTAYTRNTTSYVNTCNICSSNIILLNTDSCGPSTDTPKVGDFVTIFFDGAGGCGTYSGNIPILTYRIISSSWPTSLEVDRPLPNFCAGSCCGTARVYIYPSGMTELYDTAVPQVISGITNFENICYLNYNDVPIWNMNIPWSVSPAGLINTLNEDYTGFGSVYYLGTKEYLGYQETSGQTFFIDNTLSAETTDTAYYNSYDEIVKVEPYEQKAIAIVHYTNNSIDTFYGEKFALEPYDPAAITQTGFARNFKVSIPWLMWHKSSTGTMGEEFFVDPNVGTADYFNVRYMQSSKNSDMNDPGMRYYHLWDTHLNDDGNPSRVGKVFPDSKLIVFDDEEIVASLSNKSNRNWTLTAPKLSLVTPNTINGILTGDTQYMYVTYRFNAPDFTDSLHCNYYTKIQGPQACFTTQSQDISVKFGDEWPFLGSCCFDGYGAQEFYVLAQIVTGSTTQPDPAQWKAIDFTSQITLTGGYIPPSEMINNTFIITQSLYNSAPTYNLNNYIDLPLPTGEELKLNFGDEYYFYGNIETDIEATIYEMKFLCNLNQTQFTKTSNPTWTSGNTYITEVGLFDVEKDLVVISKLQSPILRTGTQQISVSIDF